MSERLVLAMVLVALGVTSYLIFNRWSVRQIAQRAGVEPLLAEVTAGTPVVLYFTTPFCEPCRTLQQPALAQLQTALEGRIAVVRVDSTQHPDAAERWGVLSAPTTFILDRNQKPQAVNRGVASAETLKQQILPLLN